ncbi:MAG: hypothetical protein AB7P69_01335 [Candidatus Binatia bacterium]
MAKAASSTTKGTVSGKKTTTSKPRTRAPQSTEIIPASTVSETDALASILQRLDTLEEKISVGFSGLMEEMHALKTTPAAGGAESEAVPDSSLPLVADLLRRHLMEHLTPVTAGLKRLEERVGFVANRLKHGGSSGGGQDRQKPWRHEQGRHARPPRGQPNGQRPNQGQPQQWTPPSAASVQGHFAPRPLHGGKLAEEED